MSKSEIFKKIIQQAWYFILAYFSDFLFPRVKEAFEKGKEKFTEYLWSKLKEDFKIHLLSTIETVNVFFTSVQYKQKEQLIIDSLFAKIKLPIILRPFKSIIKNLLKKKVEELIKENLDKIIHKIDEVI